MITAKKYRITDQVRFIRFIFLVMLMMVLLSVMVVNNTAYSGSNPSYTEYIVARGDTIWSIAASLETKGDIRKDVYNIIKINNLHDSMIYPGQIIRLPAE